MSRRGSLRRTGERFGASRAGLLARRAWLVTRRTPGAARRFWRSTRPTTRRGALIGMGAVGGGSAVLAVVFLAAGAMAWSPYVDSVVHPDSNARAWAALQPIITAPDACVGCHQVEAARASSARHVGIGCESCHGNLRDHILASPTSRPGTADLGVDANVAPVDGTGPAPVNVDLAADATKPAVPTDAVCVRCHAKTSGKPAALLQITPGNHYVLECLQCHDPHTGISHRPPVVLHPLLGLPPCVTCHGPEGFKTRSERHPIVTDDERCLDCHGPGRGPEPGQ